MTDNYPETIEEVFNNTPYSVVTAARRKNQGATPTRALALSAVVEGSTVGTRTLSFYVIKNDGFVICKDDEYAAAGPAAGMPDLVEHLISGPWVVTYINTSDSMGETADEVAETAAHVVNVERE